MTSANQVLFVLVLQAVQPDPKEAHHAEGAGQGPHLCGHRSQAPGTANPQNQDYFGYLETRGLIGRTLPNYNGRRKALR